MMQIILDSLGLINSVYFVILTGLGLLGVFSYRRKYPLIKDKNKFIIFVPSHNESSIIDATIENLSAISYDKKLFQVFILADNCKDDTAKRAKDAINKRLLPNFFVLERNEKDPMKRGKPHAIRWAINLLDGQQNFYKTNDLFLILDADNFVNPDILQHFNSHYESFSKEKRPVMIQSYLDCKNTKGVIARGYHVSYRILNRFSQLSRSRLGLNAMIGGTGFIIDLNFLQSIGGFNAKSLTEDLEIQTIATMMNKKIDYNHYIRVYDEKPTMLKSSFIQKTRWSQGHWWNFFHYGPKILLNGIKRVGKISQFIRSMDNFYYLSIMINYVTLFLNITLTTVLFFAGFEFKFNAIHIINIVLLLISFFIFYPFAVLKDGTALERKKFLIEWIPNYVSFAISSYIYLFSGLNGLLKFSNQHHWVKTTHSVTDLNER